MFHYYIKPEVIPNLLTEDEIEYIKKESIDKLKPSSTVCSEHVLVSEFCRLPFCPIIRSIVERCLSRIDRPIENCEELQVVRYKLGGFMVPHQDVFDQDKNKRLYTFIIALNDDYEGGETSFPNLDVKYKLKKGSVLFFHTLDNYEFRTNMALHGGESVKSGEKWVCNLWVHEHPGPKYSF
tara:strand:- start:51 stop:593 length:543 start_codon:yes stop_codon:yes gene_type:complete